MTNLKIKAGWGKIKERLDLRPSTAARKAFGSESCLARRSPRAVTHPGVHFLRVLAHLIHGIHAHLCCDTRSHRSLGCLSCPLRICASPSRRRLLRRGRLLWRRREAAALLLIARVVLIATAAAAAAAAAASIKRCPLRHREHPLLRQQGQLQLSYLPCPARPADCSQKRLPWGFDSCAAGTENSLRNAALIPLLTTSSRMRFRVASGFSYSLSVYTAVVYRWCLEFRDRNPSRAL